MLLSWLLFAFERMCAFVRLCAFVFVVVVVVVVFIVFVFVCVFACFARFVSLCVSIFVHVHNVFKVQRSQSKCSCSSPASC